MRLVGEEEPGRGASEGEGGPVSAGRLEVRYLGMWGTVCDDDFGLEEGHVRKRVLDKECDVEGEVFS